jgi:hypothetical protein
MFGFSFVDSGLRGLVEVEGAFSWAFFLSPVEVAGVLAGSCDWIDWAITRTELAKSDEASNRAVATREKLFILENLQILQTGQKREVRGDYHSEAADWCLHASRNIQF